MANVKKKQSRRRAPVNLPAMFLILALLAGVCWQLYGMQNKIKDAQAEKESLAAEVAGLQRENDALEADIAEGNTPEKVEEIARDELGWVTPGEYAFYPRNS